MGAGGPVSLGDVPSPPLPASPAVPGGGELFSFGGQPYWRDSSGNTTALTSAGTTGLGWSEPAFTAAASPGAVSLDSFTGTADQKMTAAIAAVVAAGGGTVQLSDSAYTFANQWATSYVSSSVTTAIRILGAGVAFNGAWGAPSAATTVTFTYAGAGAACMDFQHNGTIEVTGIQFISANTGIPLMQTTNATPNIHDNVFSGGGSTVTCATDAIVLGGTGLTTGSGDTAKYNAYQGQVYRNFFDGVRRFVYFQSAANSIQVHDNTISANCGTNLFQGAAAELLGNSTKSCAGNAIYGNCIECVGYAFAVKAQYASGNTLGPNGLFDMTASTFIAGYYIGPNGSGNEIIDGYRTTVVTPLAWDTNGNNRQRNMQRGAGQYEDFHQPVGFKNNAGAPQSFYFGESVIGVETTGNQGYWRTFPGANPYPIVQVITVAATQVTDGSTVSGSNWLTSLTAAFALADVGQAVGGTGISSNTQIQLAVTATTAFKWQASTVYNLGDVIRPATANAHLYQCTTAGTSGSSQPAFPTDGSTVTDGTVVWTDIGTSTAAWLSQVATATAAGVTIGISRSSGSALTMTGFSRHHIISTGTAPSAAADTAAGSGATASATGNDLAFTLTFTTGSGSPTAPTSGQVCHVSQAIGYTSAPKSALTAKNANAAAAITAGVWLVTTTSQWQLNFVSAPAENTAYIFDVISVQ